MPQDTASRRFLLVEDEAMIAMLVEDMLEDLGHELIRVATRLEDASPLGFVSRHAPPRAQPWSPRPGTR